VEEFTHDWEASATHLPWLWKEWCIQSYESGLKPHIQAELKMHNITSM
jgi:hypothetical protein